MLYPVLKLFAIVCQISQLLYFPVKSNDHRAILGSQVFEEFSGSLLDVIKHSTGAETGVKHQHHIQGFFACVEITDLLFNLVIEQMKRVNLQIGHVTIVAVADDHRNADQVGVDRDGVGCLRFLGLDNSGGKKECSRQNQ